MKIVLAVTALCICANLLPAKAADVTGRCRNARGVITITKEDNSGGCTCANCDERIYYRIDGTTSQERTQATYLKQQQKGNPRTLDVVKKMKVENHCEAEKAAHKAVSDYHFKDKWYTVKPNKKDDFLQAVEKAVKDMETFLAFTAMIKYGPHKNGRLFHFA